MTHMRGLVLLDQSSCALVVTVKGELCETLAHGVGQARRRPKHSLHSACGQASRTQGEALAQAPLLDPLPAQVNELVQAAADVGYEPCEVYACARTYKCMYNCVSYYIYIHTYMCVYIYIYIASHLSIQVSHVRPLLTCT
jgi:hypothetical protein